MTVEDLDLDLNVALVLGKGRRPRSCPFGRRPRSPSIGTSGRAPRIGLPTVPNFGSVSGARSMTTHFASS